MRITMFMPGLGPAALGAQVHQDFARAVRALGHDFQILTTMREGEGEMPSAGVLPLPWPWQAIDRIAAPWVRTRNLLSPAAALARHLRRDGDGIDLLHVEVAYPFAAAAFLATRRSRWSGPMAITPMGEDTLLLDSPRYGFRHHAVPRRLVARTLQAAHVIRCISPLHERAIASIAPETPRRVIPLNVSDAVVALSQEPASTRAARRLAARRRLDEDLGTRGRPVILSLGRLHPFKGIDVLIGALRHLPDTHLVVAGPSLKLKTTGDEAARLSGLAARWGLEKRVSLVGPVPPARATDLLAAADVLAVPSHLESLNKVCVEATAVGTPFVVTESTGISAWARSWQLGLVVPPRDEKALAAGIQEALGTKCRPDLIPRFVGEFSPGAVARAVMAFYAEFDRRQ